MFPVNIITRHYVTFYKTGIFIITFARSSLLANVYTYCNTKKLYFSTTVFIITQGNMRATCFD